jgi:hypothetical protein
VFIRPGEHVGEPADHHTPATEEWEYNNYCHYQICDCGEIFDKENHHGGTATTTALAICEDCGQRYGSLLADDETTAKDPDQSAPETNAPEKETDSNTASPETEGDAGDTNAPETQEGGNASSGGCTGAMGFGTIAITMISLFSLLSFKKKEEQ